MNIPTCCDQPMLVCAGGVFQCGVCESETTLRAWENRQEESGLRFQADGFAREQAQLAAWARASERGEL